MPTTPFGRLVRVSVNPPVGSIVRLTGPLTLCFGFELSVTVTVAVDVPAAVGVPLTVQPVSVRPAGSAPPVTVQTYGAVPPVTPIVPVYGTPTSPFGRLGDVSVRLPGEVIVRLNGPLTLCCGFDASVTCTVMLEIPASVGVPLIVQLFCVNPAGKVPAVIVQTNGAVPPLV